MKATINVKKEVELKTLHVDAGVRYWEDTEIDGEPDTENGDNIPCKEGHRWKPVIDIVEGRILNWEQGKRASIHYKVCDDGSYFLKDEKEETVLSIERNYVPDMLCPKDEWYGDYTIMDIDENGKIADWKQTLEGFQNEDED